MDIENLFDMLKREAEMIRDAKPTTDEATKKTLEWIAGMNGENDDRL